MNKRIVFPGRVLFRMCAGEDPEDIPTRRDVISGVCSAAPHIDKGGDVDRVLNRYSRATRVYRVFDSAKNTLSRGMRHTAWDDREREIGLSRTFAVDIDRDADVFSVVNSLRAVARVESATPVFCSTTPFDDDQPIDIEHSLQEEREDGAEVDRYYAFDMVGGTQALAFEPGDPTVIVAIVDSGIARSHCEFSDSDKVRSGFDMVDFTSSHVGEGLELFGDFNGRDGEPDDYMGHGTGCAGIIGAKGLRVPPGLAGRSPILPLRAMAAARRGPAGGITAIGSAMDIDAAMKRAVDLGARVVNMSFGTSAALLGPDDPIPHIEIVRYALARGCVLIAASGNAGNDVPYYPAALPGVIAVGAVGADGRPSVFTSYGPHVSLCAPGERIPTPSLTGYTFNTGTSFAAPFVAAAAALVLSRGMRYAAPLPVSTVRTILEATADPFGRNSSQDGFGHGILNIPTALGFLDNEFLHAQNERKENYACEGTPVPS